LLFDAAQEPKRWIGIDGIGHFDLYQGELLKRFVKEIVGFFNEFIGTR
jgi:hypothetical protein